MSASDGDQIVNENPGVRWFDAHCHLQWDEIDDGAIARARAAGVDRMVCVGTDLKTSREAIDVAVANEGVYAAVGLHPHDAKNGVKDIEMLVNELTKEQMSVLVGIGECGLDYFYEHSPKKIQRDAFEYQIDLAKRFDRSLIIHTRDAWDETFEILRSVGVPTRTVVHCFTGGKREAEIALELGVYLSFSGITTFKNAVEVQEAAAFCPLNRMTIETDSPFLAPVPHRGRPNAPENTGVVGSFISGLKKLRVEEFASEVTRNTERLFNL